MQKPKKIKCVFTKIDDLLIYKFAKYRKNTLHHNAHIFIKFLYKKHGKMSAGINWDFS